VWDLNKIKRGKLNHYIIKKADSKVVTNQFTFNDPEKILVTTSTNLRIEKRIKTLKK